MALIEMDFAMGNGEHYEKTLLWTNSSPSSTFSGQTIYLSSNLSDFDFVGIIHNFSTSDQGKDNEVIYDLSDNFDTGNNKIIGSFGGVVSNLVICRYYYVSPTNNYIVFGSCHILNNQGLYDNYLIPYEIIGYKKVGGSSTANAVVGTFNGGAYTTTDTVTLGFKPTKLMVWGSNGANSVVEILSPEDGIDYEKHTASNGTSGTGSASSYITFTDTGFTYKKPSASIYSSLVCYYMAYTE